MIGEGRRLSTIVCFHLPRALSSTLVEAEAEADRGGGGGDTRGDREARGMKTAETLKRLRSRGLGFEV